MKTFVFSATLSKDLQGNLKRGNWRRNKKNVKSNTLDDLFGKLDFRDDKPEVIDISPEGRLVASLRESMVECMINEKVGIAADGTAQCFWQYGLTKHFVFRTFISTTFCFGTLAAPWYSWAALMGSDASFLSLRCSKCQSIPCTLNFSKSNVSRI